jgi:hypothetical protein
MTISPDWQKRWQQTAADALLDAAPSQKPDVPLPVACYDHQRQCWVLGRLWSESREPPPLYTPDALETAQSPPAPQDYWLHLRPGPRRLTLHWPVDGEEGTVL